MQSGTAQIRKDTSVLIDTFEVGLGSLSVAVKDVVDIEGYPTRLGSRAFANAEPANEHADVVKRLLDGDVRLIGKANMHELAYGVTGLNGVYGTPRNPKFAGLIPGGSSSGSAVAVGSGLCDASIGTDTGGSIRVPAACCGVLGLKPTFGRVSRKGLTPASSSLDCVGPFAKDAGTLDKIMSLIASDWRHREPKSDTRIAWLKCAAEPGIWFAANTLAGKLQPDLDELELALLDDAHLAGLKIIARETFQAFGHLLETSSVDPEVAARLEKARLISDDEIVRAEDVRATITRELDELFEAYDVLALPTLAGYPPEIANAGDLMSMVEITRLCRPFNLSGHPAISIPLKPINGKPVALQLVAAKHNDEVLVDLAARLEAEFAGDLQPREALNA